VLSEGQTTGLLIFGKQYHTVIFTGWRCQTCFMYSIIFILLLMKT